MMQDMMKQCCRANGKPDFENMKQFMGQCGKGEFMNLQPRLSRCCSAGTKVASFADVFLKADAEILLTCVRERHIGAVINKYIKYSENHGGRSRELNQS